MIEQKTRRYISTKFEKRKWSGERHTFGPTANALMALLRKRVESYNQAQEKEADDLADFNLSRVSIKSTKRRDSRHTHSVEHQQEWHEK